MKYLIPYIYATSTRAKTLFYKVSIILFVFIPSYIVTFYLGVKQDFFNIKYLLAFTMMYCVYEIGYIYNDIYTTKYEDTPTYRLTNIEQKKIEKLYILLISFRVIYICIFAWILKSLKAMNLSIFLSSLVLLYLFYSFHNYFRGNWNMITMFLIVSLKYISVPLLFIEKSKWGIMIIVLVLLVPFLRMIEYGNKLSYKLFKLKNYDIFRIIYYGILTIFSTLLYYKSNMFKVFVIISMYFLLMRIGTFMIIKITKSKIRAREEGREGW